MTLKTNTNGQARKSLAEQIDRLDAMLDGLADGLNDAVAAAVKEAVGVAVQQAVQTVVREMLTSPELLARFAAVGLPVAAPAPEPATPKAKVGWKQRWFGVCKAVTAQLNAARLWCGRRLHGVGRWTAGMWLRVRMLACYSKQLLIAAGVGMTVGAAAYLAGPSLAAAFSGIGGFVAAAAVQAGLALRRLLTPAVGSSVSGGL
jgi:hypothetical protein